jgi:hypothetical protein
MATDQPLAQPGDVFYFHDLYLDTAQRTKKHPDYQNTYEYKVHGKSRPMIVVDVVAEGEGTGRKRYFLVLKLSTKKSKFKERLGFRRVGPILDERVSYFDSTPYWLPENLIDGFSKHLDPLTFTSICSLSGAKGRPAPMPDLVRRECITD